MRTYKNNAPILRDLMGALNIITIERSQTLGVLMVAIDTGTCK